MRSQLSFNRRVVYSLAILLLIGQSVSVAAEKFTLSGEVIWPDEEKKKRPKIILKGEKSYDEKINSKGAFKIKRVIGGEYSLQVQVNKETVHEETNPRYHKLIKKFKEITGCPLIVNTSFNIRGEPIVCSPYDAFMCFMGTELDLLIIENFILYKEEQKALNSKENEKFTLD